MVTKASNAKSDQHEAIRSFTLRVGDELLKQVDEAVAHNLVLKSRNTWIVNAIVEQLKRERKK